VLFAAVVLAGCGGGGSGTTTGARPLDGTDAELRWALAVDRFASGLLPDLRRLARLTGGDANAGVAGTRLDPRIFQPGATREQFKFTMTSLAACGLSLKAGLPKAPSARLQSVRRTLVHACSEFELVPDVLREDVLGAGSAGQVKRATVEEAASHANEGERSVVDALTSVRRLLGAQP
jgi:hypothetical protein